MADLITLSEFKTYADINSTGQDDLLNFLIPKVSLMVKNYCGRTFIDYFSVDKVDVSSGGTTSIYLQESPLVSVTSVEGSIDNGNTYTAMVAFTDYAINYETESIDSLYQYNNCGFPKLLNGYRITYKAGYSTTPEDLKLALVDLITYYLQSDMAVKSTRSPGSSSTQVEYVMNATLPSHIRRILDTYRLIL